MTERHPRLPVKPELWFYINIEWTKPFQVPKCIKFFKPGDKEYNNFDD